MIHQPASRSRTEGRRGIAAARFRGAARVKPIGERSRAVPFFVPLVTSYPLV